MTLIRATVQNEEWTDDDEAVDEDAELSTDDDEAEADAEASGSLVLVCLLTTRRTLRGGSGL